MPRDAPRDPYILVRFHGYSLGLPAPNGDPRLSRVSSSWLLGYQQWFPGN